MKTLEEQMSFYLRYHRNPKNKLTHFFGVPLIMFSLFVLLGLVWFQIGDVSITAASVLAIGVLAYYFWLDAVLAVAMTLFTAVLLIAANRVCTLGAPVALTVFGVAFVGGWILQLIGHGFEGRKPALVDNFFQAFIAPIFLMAEVFFALGYKRDVAERVERLALEAERSR
ncbi:MAG TPA: Mpo1-like protein [Burkholderiaceae bacterium]|nr:Mpo1-like protein [Burkholderiaceae bacterium]